MKTFAANINGKTIMGSLPSVILQAQQKATKTNVIKVYSLRPNNMFSRIVAEVTPEEFRLIRKGRLIRTKSLMNPK